MKTIFFKLTFRNIRRNRVAMATKIIGLAIGLAAAILLVIFILQEGSYDRHFSQADRTYRLNSIWMEQGNSTVYPINLRDAYTAIPQKVAGIDKAVQIYMGGNEELISGNTRFANNQLLYVDSTFFDVFDFSAVEGNIKTALNAPNSLVITQKTADKIFGNNDAVGQVLQKNDVSYTVSAVINNVPINTHFTFDFLQPMTSIGYMNELGGLEFFTYYLLGKGVNQQEVVNNICTTNSQMLSERFKMANSTFSSSAEPLKKLHLYSKAAFDLSRQGSIRTVVLVGIIAFLIMFLALTNFVNLFVVEGEQRSKEIGVRKVNGATKTSIVNQFFAETSLIVAIAFFIGIMLAFLLLPQFSNLMQRNFSVELLKSPMLVFSLLAIFVTTVVLAGSYPAFYLSKFTPVAILTPQTGKTGRKKFLMNFSGGLQIFVTLFLLTYMFGINHQTHYLKNLSPGFNPNGLVNIFSLNENVKSHYSAIREQLLQIPEISGVSASIHTIGGGVSGQGIRLLESAEDNQISINEYRIQPGLCELMEFQLKEGRFFDEERPTDRKGVILNEAAMDALGLSSALERKVVMFDEPMEVIGVVKNFRYESAANSIQPLVLTAYSDNFWNMVVRIVPNADMSTVMTKIEKTIKSFDDGYIINSAKTQDIYKNYYADEERLAQLTRLSAVLAIIIVAMGIFMLISQSIARRTKEIGIRKVLGGSIIEMLMLIYSSSLKITFIAAVIAIPLSYFMLQSWLQNFAVKAPLAWWLFLQGLAIVLILQFLITFGQTWRAATRNPVEALRDE